MRTFNRVNKFDALAWASTITMMILIIPFIYDVTQSTGEEIGSLEIVGTTTYQRAVMLMIGSFFFGAFIVASHYEDKIMKIRELVEAGPNKK